MFYPEHEDEIIYRKWLRLLIIVSSSSSYHRPPLEIDSVYDADTTLNVVWKPSAMKIPSFDGGIYFEIMQKRHCFRIEMKNVYIY